MLLSSFAEPESRYGDAQPAAVQLGECGAARLLGCWFGLLASLFGGAAALRARYRAGDAQLRRQVLWLAYGALLVPLWLGGDVAARAVSVLGRTRPTASR